MFVIDVWSVFSELHKFWRHLALQTGYKFCNTREGIGFAFGLMLSEFFVHDVACGQRLR